MSSFAFIHFLNTLDLNFLAEWARIADLVSIAFPSKPRFKVNYNDSTIEPVA